MEHLGAEAVSRIIAGGIITAVYTVFYLVNQYRATRKKGKQDADEGN